MFDATPRVWSCRGCPGDFYRGGRWGHAEDAEDCFGGLARQAVSRKQRKPLRPLRQFLCGLCDENRVSGAPSRTAPTPRWIAR